MHEKSKILLQKAVEDELSAVHQYMYFHFHCDDQGFDLLAGLFLRTAIEEMRHIELLAERILFLKGDVDLKPSHAPEKIQDVRKMLNKARAMEEQSTQDYNEAASACGSDAVSRKLFEALIVDEERHFGQYDTEADNIERFGDSYLAQQSMERSRATAAMMPGAAGKGGA
ncbi:MAG: manganese catalase family protein [Magnetococcales bacterium]|nr:manganese catalase family protein [Magnetococcales bacterium]MBF0114245.1 manganese catalase family protein [Magnetococcales bacterium]